MLRKTILALAAVVLLAAAACGGDEESILTKGARFPDAEGVATEMTLERIEIDGDKTYAIGENAESFTTRSHEPAPLLSWKDKYVHVGLNDDGGVAWVAGVGTVIDGDPPYTLYTGVFERVDDETNRAVFEDGTTLAIKKGIDLPQTGETVVTIEPAQHVIIKIEAA